MGELTRKRLVGVIRFKAVHAHVNYLIMFPAWQCSAPAVAAATADRNSGTADAERREARRLGATPSARGCISYKQNFLKPGGRFRALYTRSEPFFNLGQSVTAAAKSFGATKMCSCHVSLCCFGHLLPRAAGS